MEMENGVVAIVVIIGGGGGDGSTGSSIVQMKIMIHLLSPQVLIKFELEMMNKTQRSWRWSKRRADDDDEQNRKKNAEKNRQYFVSFASVNVCFVYICNEKDENRDASAQHTLTLDWLRVGFVR